MNFSDLSDVGIRLQIQSVSESVPIHYIHENFEGDFVDTPKIQALGQHFNWSKRRLHSMTFIKVRVIDELMTNFMPTPEAKAVL